MGSAVRIGLTLLSASLLACGAPLPDLGETAARCGDGAVQGLEACDDGNAINTDACTDQCALARCGDSFVQEGEACDDGNISDRDACTNACVVATCGDGNCTPAVPSPIQVDFGF